MFVFSGFPGGASGKEPTCQCRKREFDPWVGTIPWMRAWRPIPVFFAWRILWTEEPGRLQSMVSLRVGHDWSDLWIHICLFTYWSRNLTQVSCIGKQIHYHWASREAPDWRLHIFKWLGIIKWLNEFRYCWLWRNFCHF